MEPVSAAPRRASPLLLAALFWSAGALAQPAPPPPALEPLPEVPGVGGDAELEPQVTITRKDGETIEEARVNGQLKWIRVTPRHGRPYYLIPDAGGQLYIRRDNFDTGLRVPLWLLFTF